MAPLDRPTLLPNVTHPQDVVYLYKVLEGQIATSPVDAGDVLTLLAYMVAGVLCGSEVPKEWRWAYWRDFGGIVDTLLFEQKIEEG